MGRGRAVGALVALLVAPVGLVACGGGDDGDAGGDATSLPHASDLPSARDSDQAASDPLLNQENPQRFIARWAATEARMQNTGKTSGYLALSHDCAACRKLAHTVEGYYAAGGYVHGGAWRIDSIRRSPPLGGYETYTVRAHTAPADIRESSSSRVLHLPTRPVSYQIGLLADGASFSVVLRNLGA